MGCRWLSGHNLLKRSLRFFLRLRSLDLARHVDEALRLRGIVGLGWRLTRHCCDYVVDEYRGIKLLIHA